ncbi:MAG: hypothetical protein ACI9LG_001576 [Moritella dasanensis]|jgi:hypothetical protein
MTPSLVVSRLLLTHPKNAIRFEINTLNYP